MHPHMNRHDEDPRLAPLLRRLRELPAELRPPFDWIEFRERAREPRRAIARINWRHAAAAATLASVIIAVAVWTRVIDPGAAPRLAESPAGAQWHQPDVAAGWLASLPDAPAIVRVDTRFAVADLEDSIAWMDELITIERAGAAQPARVKALQRERSRLVDSLVRVRYAETLAAELP